MTGRARPSIPRTVPATAPVAVVASLLALVVAATLALGGPGPAPRAVADDTAVAAAARTTPNPVTPGGFTGLGFDQCLAPEQWKMDRWLQSSPFLAVGIYISGKSRGCREQPNLTPTWIRTQLAKGWRLLPITLGPQASCLRSFPRYGDDPTINPKPGRNGGYSLARTQGRTEADTTVRDALALGLTKGSTLFYDLEGFDHKNTDCRESALSFLSAWTQRLHALGWRSGVYSSAGSGILALDEARRKRPGTFVLPDTLWIARWDGVANTSTTYIPDDGWRRNRIKQYRGGHKERWGQVTINIDSNYLDVGNGSVAAPETHCGGVKVDLPSYGWLSVPRTGYRAPRDQVRALQCFLRERKLYAGQLNGNYNPRVVTAVRAWQKRTGQPQRSGWTRKNWMTLLATGTKPVLKVGSYGAPVRRLQRTLNAADPAARLTVSGVVTSATVAAVRRWQQANRLEVSGVVGADDWPQLAKGNR
ncbi:glycoside hydrolase domain-containing protein [Nocardioides sp. SYSU D00038]|uniref:glycoside hydrolase domain-containing protein n=1 Tax=Nocardioides sp. SYSU D00038 TaxID=2812554 RepID=UPI0019677DB2|nr:glycoside hydrolase domain-containing protein [Nocardioides sp. SYSU D00038]